MRAVPLVLFLIVHAVAAFSWPWTSVAVEPQTGPFTAGTLVWQAFGHANFSKDGYFNQYNSYSGQPASQLDQIAIRSTSKVIPPGIYGYEFTARIFESCGAGFQPCNATNAVVNFCPRMAIYMSCTRSDLGQSVVQPNYCTVGSTPPTGFPSCVGPVNDGHNFLLAARSSDLFNTLTSGTSPVFTNTQASISYVDISQQSNCTLVVNFSDECNYGIPSGYDLILTQFYFNLYNIQ